MKEQQLQTGALESMGKSLGGLALRPRQSVSAKKPSPHIYVLSPLSNGKIDSAFEGTIFLFHRQES